MAGGYVGSAAYLAFGGTVLDTFYRNFTPTQTGATVDQTSGADTAIKRLFTLKDGNASMTYRAETGTAGTPIWALMPIGASGTLEWGPEGTATSAPRAHVQAFLTAKTPPIIYNDVTVWQFSWEFDDVITETVY